MEEKISWDRDVTILFNRFILADVGKALLVGVGVVALVLAVLLMLEGCPAGVGIGIKDLKYPLILLVSTFFLGMLFILLFWGNKYPVSYYIDRRGIRFVTQTSQRRKNWLMNWLLIVTGFFARSSSAVGTGILGLSGQDMVLNWKSIRRVKVYQRQRVIVLKAGLMGKMIVFCRQDNFQEVWELITKRTTPAAQ